MYTKESLKQMLKKANKTKASLTRAHFACNETVYTEQNKEELNETKAYIEYKIDLLNDIINLINNFLAGNLHCNIDELFETLNYYKDQFNVLSNDERLSRLQQIYTRKIDEEVICL